MEWMFEDNGSRGPVDDPLFVSFVHWQVPDQRGRRT
jgi:hypothetical protein